MADTLVLVNDLDTREKLIAFHDRLVLKFASHRVIGARMKADLKSWKDRLEKLDLAKPAKVGDPPNPDDFITGSVKQRQLNSYTKYEAAFQAWTNLVIQDPEQKSAQTIQAKNAVNNRKKEFNASIKHYESSQKAYENAMKRHGKQVDKYDTAKVEYKANKGKLEGFRAELVKLVNQYNQECVYDEPLHIRAENLADVKLFKEHYEKFVPTTHYFHQSNQVDAQGRSNSYYCYNFPHNGFELHVHCDSIAAKLRTGTVSRAGRLEGEKSIVLVGNWGLTQFFATQFPRQGGIGHVDINTINWATYKT